MIRRLVPGHRRMSFFDFLKPKPQTMYDQLVKLYELGKQLGGSAYVTHRFAYDYLPKKLYRETNSIFPEIQENGTKLVVRLYRDLFAECRIDPKKEDIESLSVSYHPQIAGR